MPYNEADNVTFRLRRGTLKTLDPHDHASATRAASYWASRPAAERIAAVEFLRIQYSGPCARLQRILRVTEREPR
jgi:hypothetical protein